MNKIEICRDKLLENKNVNTRRQRSGESMVTYSTTGNTVDCKESMAFDWQLNKL